jgi:hypothetical protein
MADSNKEIITLDELFKGKFSLELMKAIEKVSNAEEYSATENENEVVIVVLRKRVHYRLAGSMTLQKAGAILSAVIIFIAFAKDLVVHLFAALIH